MNREVGCHAKCDHYKKYRKEIEKISKNRKKFSEEMGLTLASYRKAFL